MVFLRLGHGYGGYGSAPLAQTPGSRCSLNMFRPICPESRSSRGWRGRNLWGQWKHAWWDQSGSTEIVGGHGQFIIFFICYIMLLWFTEMYYDLLWFTMMYYGLLWSTMIYYDVLWCTMIYYDLLWCTMIYYDLLWFTMFYYDLLWFTMMYYDYDVLWFTMIYFFSRADCRRLCTEP